MKTGYSQKSRIEATSASTKKTTRAKKVVPKTIASKHNEYDNVAKNSQKAFNACTARRDSKEEPLPETKEVDRIINVLQRNLGQPFDTRLGYTQMMPSNDPKRAKVRRLLHKHFQMKEEKHRQSHITIDLTNDTVDAKDSEKDNNEIIKSLSGFLKRLEEKSATKRHSSRYHAFEGHATLLSKCDTLEFLPDEVFTATRVQNGDNKVEISMQFEDISHISNSSSSAGLNEESGVLEYQKIFKKYSTDEKEQRTYKHKLRVL